MNLGLVTLTKTTTFDNIAEQSYFLVYPELHAPPHYTTAGPLDLFGQAILRSSKPDRRPNPPPHNVGVLGGA